MARKCTKPLEQRFWERVVRSDGCWEWVGAADERKRVTRFVASGQYIVAYRYSYELAYGPIPHGRTVTQGCGNWRCVRPTHLELGWAKRGRLEIRFWEKVLAGSGCWEWQGGRDPNGYGRFGFGTRRVELAHRVAYRLAYGSLNKSIIVCHKCDNPSCVRPDHLFLGTQSHNMRDMTRKSRGGNQSVTWDIVRAMRAEYEAGGVTKSEVARAYGVSISAGHGILSRKTWRDDPLDVAYGASEHTEARAMTVARKWIEASRIKHGEELAVERAKGMQTREAA